MKRFQQSWKRQQTKQGLFGAHVDKDRNKYRPIPVLLPCLLKFYQETKTSTNITVVNKIL